MIQLRCIPPKVRHEAGGRATGGTETRWLERPSQGGFQTLHGVLRAALDRVDRVPSKPTFTILIEMASLPYNLPMVRLVALPAARGLGTREPRTARLDHGGESQTGTGASW